MSTPITHTYVSLTAILFIYLLTYLLIFHVMLGYPDKAYECTGWRKKRGHHLIANILKFHDRIAWKLVNFYNIIMLNTVINFLFKNFIALWRHHIAEVHQLSRNSIMKFSEYFQ